MKNAHSPTRWMVGEGLSLSTLEDCRSPKESRGILAGWNPTNKRPIRSNKTRSSSDGMGPWGWGERGPGSRGVGYGVSRESVRVRGREWSRSSHLKPPGFGETLTDW